MKVLNKSILLLLTSCLLLSASCGKKNETSSIMGDAPQMETAASDQAGDSSKKKTDQDTHTEETVLTDASDHASEGQGDESSSTNGDTKADSVQNQTDEDGNPAEPDVVDDNDHSVKPPESQSDEDQRTEYPGVTDFPVVPDNQSAKDIADCDIYVTVQSVDISLDDLKANNYVVPVYITLDKNAGINYTEWGVYYDARCKAEAVSSAREHVNFNTVFSVNEGEHFIWTAWATANGADYPGILLKLNVTLPMDAALGDTYPITYANVSLADKPHVWNGTDADWAKKDAVGWKNGGITIAETSTLSVPTFDE